LLEMGLGDSVFDAGDGRLIEGEQVSRLVRTLAALEDALIALERRGISLRAHAERQDPQNLRLPVYHVFLGFEDFWFVSRDQLDEFVKSKEAELGHELRVEAGAGIPVAPSANGGPDDAGEDAAVEDLPKLRIVELHEVRTINTSLGDLSEMGFAIDALIPQDRTGMEGSRYLLRRGDSETGLDDLRGLPGAIRAAGERGLQITRFKGLGEMNAEELRETTLDPANRTLLQVKMEDAGSADELFRVLMGDNVEPRREFIQKHALDVKNLDV
ncbi:MAG: DNA gyrase subunit B, partial [Planctomycetales bacterium]|nr:DNA gyrase subunit B [Planctomycetales bacterium]